jgi:hypothetical protein
MVSCGLLLAVGLAPQLAAADEQPRRACVSPGGDAHDYKTPFDVGNERLSAGDLAGAAECFGASYRRMPTMPALLNWAVMLESSGRMAAALEKYQRVIEQAASDHSIKPETVAQIQELVARRLPDMPALTVTVLDAGAAPPAAIHQAAIRVDDEPDARLTADGPILLDANDRPHEIHVSKEGYLPAHVAVGAVARGKPASVEVRLQRAAPAHDEAAPAATKPRQEERGAGPTARVGIALAPATVEQRGDVRRAVGWASAVGAVIAGGSSVYFLITRNQRADTFNQNGNGCGEALFMRGAPGCQGQYDRIKSAEHWAIGGLIAAGALGGSSLVLLLTAPPRAPAPPRGAALACAPAFGRHVGLGCEVRF